MRIMQQSLSQPVMPQRRPAQKGVGTGAAQTAAAPQADAFTPARPVKFAGGKNKQKMETDYDPGWGARDRRWWNYVDEYGDTPLTKAAREKDYDWVKLLLEKGAEVNYKNHKGDTALTVAAFFGHPDVVKLLLENGAEVNHKNKSGKTARTLAELGGHREIATLLEVAEKIQKALNAGQSIDAVDDSGMSLLTAAAASGHSDAVKLLLENGAEVNHKNKGGTALMAAAFFGHPDVVKLLLENGADVNHKNKSGKTARTLAELRGHREIATLLKAPEKVKAAAEAAQKAAQRAAFLEAAGSGDIDKVKALLSQSGVDINHQDADGETALMLAAMKGHTEIVKEILEKPGIKVNLQNQYGETALMWAAMNGHTEIAALLKKAEEAQKTKAVQVIQKWWKKVSTAKAQADPAGPSTAQPHQPAASSSAQLVSRQEIQQAANTLLQYLESQKPLGEGPPEVKESMSYQTSREVARQLREKIKKNRGEKAAVLENLKAQHQNARPYPGEEDTERELRLFWNLVSQQVFGKTVPEIENNAPIGFNAVIGMEKEKEELMDRVVLPLNRFKQQEQSFRLVRAGKWSDPDVYREEQLGGVLLYGKPGTGKSWLAARLAEELEMRPIVVDSANIINSKVGDSEKNLEAAFTQAAQQQPSVLIMDEIDSLLPKRQGSQLAHHEKRLTNQMLKELERAPQRGILVVGTTNCINDIDSAALERSGRFSLKLPVRLPEEGSRKELFRYYLDQIKRSNSFPYTEEELNQLASLSQDLNTDEIKEVCKTADRYGRKSGLAQPSVELIKKKIQEVFQYKSDLTNS